VARWIETVGLVAGVVLIVRLFFVWLDVYFVLFGEQPDPTPADERRHVVTVAWCLGVLTVATAVAFVAGHVRVAATGIALVGVALVATLVFSVPTGRWTPEAPAVEQPDADYHPCYTGSGDCLGG
jgi:hypothetical protein